jgi:hypothetical protein
MLINRESAITDGSSDEQQPERRQPDADGIHPNGAGEVGPDDAPGTAGDGEDPKTGYNCINARAETVATKPSFRQAYRKRRCLIPVDGFFEWEQSTPKQPYFIHRADAKPFAPAGVWVSS